MITFLYSIAVPAIVSFLTAYFVQERKLSREFRLEKMAEDAARKLLESELWGKRSFDAIKDRLGGFSDDELRKVLVCAGAVRFKGQDGKELWGLLERNRDSI